MFSRKGTPIRVDIQYMRIIDTADRSHEFDNFDDSEHFDDSHRPDSFDKSDHFECQLYHDQSKKKKICLGTIEAEFLKSKTYRSFSNPVPWARAL